MSSNQQTVHDKLLEDQQKMIEMYQQALQQILDFRGQFFKEQMEMQMNLAKEREQMTMMQQNQRMMGIPSMADNRN
jgi:hypothetical protein